jgi:hypothetical protein
MTAISTALPSLVPRLIWGLAARSEGLLAGYQIAEALYHATLHMHPSERGSRVYKLYNTILAQTRLAQTTFQGVDGITIFLCARRVLEQVRGRSPSFASYSATRAQESAWAIALTGVVCALAMGLLKTIHRSLPHETTQGNTDRLNYTATLGWNTRQLSLQAPQMARILLEVALACLSKHPFWSACGAVASTASLINTLRIRQLSVTATLNQERQDAIGRHQSAEQQRLSPTPLWQDPYFTPWPDPTYAYIAQATVTTQFLSPAAVDEECLICLESLANTPTANPCPNEHPLHMRCLSEQLANCMQTLAHNNGLRTTKVTVQDELGRRMHEYYRHRVEINASDLNQLFQCSQCRAPILFEPVIEDALVHCDYRGAKDAKLAESLTIIDPSRAPLFARLCTAYNVAQAVLARLYRYPELAPHLWSIQKLSLAFDLIEFSHTLYALHQKMKTKRYGTEERNLTFSFKYVAGAVSLLALSCLAVKGLGRFLYPHALLKELVSTSNALDIRWDAPRIYFAIQSLALSRAVASFALSFFSSQARQDRFNALANLCTAAGLSQLRWLCVTKTLLNPLAHAASTGGLISGLLNKKNVKQLEMDCFFMVPSSCAFHREHLRSVVHAISDYTRQMFDASHWTFDWSVITRNGVRSDSIYLGVQLKSRALASCTCTLLPQMTDSTMRAFVHITRYFFGVDFRTFSGWVRVYG